MEEQKRSIPWKWIVVALVLVGLGVVWKTLPIQDWLTAFNDWVASLGTAGLVVYGLFYIVATVLFLPGSLITLGSGFLFGVVWGTVMVSISATIGASLAFLVARYLARGWVEEKAKGSERFQAVDRAIGQQGGKIVFLLRLSPALPFNLSNYLYGLTGVQFWPYVLATWVGTFPGTVMYVYLGAVSKAGLAAATGSEGTPMAQQVLFAVGLIATVVVTVFVTRVAQKALAETAVEK